MATCISIERISLVTPDFVPVENRWQRYADQLPLAFPACISSTDISQLAQLLTANMLADGWVTARLGIPAQNLSSGTLQFVLIVGKLKKVIVSSGVPESRWRVAMANVIEAPINLKDIEQSVDQIQSIPSQKATLEISPADEVGYSLLNLQLEEVKPRYRGSAGWDNQGAKSINTNQFTTNLTLDRPFGMADQVNINSISSKGQGGYSQSFTTAYSLPVGYHTLGWNQSYESSVRLIKGSVQTFVSGNVSNGWSGSWAYRLFRDDKSKLDMTLSQGRDQSTSTIDGTEILIQHRDQAWAKAQLGWRQQVADGSSSITVGYKVGLPHLGGIDDPHNKQPTSGTRRFQIHTLDINHSQKWDTLAGKEITWRTKFGAQGSNDILLSDQHFSIGTSSNVRGFGAGGSLMAERGWFLQNEIARNTSVMGQGETWIGIDVGEVSGPNVTNLPATHMAGFAMGQRAKVGIYSYDLLIGMPLYGPKSLLNNTGVLTKFTLKGTF